MSNNDFVKNLLIEQRRRLVGSLMDYIEKSVYPSLTLEQRKNLREKVLSSVGTYHDTCLDILKASVNDGSEMVNELAVKALADLNTAIAEMRAS